jgi:hypothetical protein
MKNINNIVYPTDNKYYSTCKCKGFFCSTPNGGDYVSCPFCDKWEYKYHGWENFTKYNNDESNMIHLNFCGSCGVLYEAGCVHQVNGCTDNLYNAHVVRKWKHKPSGNIYVGMPQFESPKEWESEVNNIEILEWVCVGAGHCPEGSYSKSKYPSYYTNEVCDLI